MKFIDLGLPSGTLWGEKNEEGHFTFDKAKEKYGDNLPTIEQWQELIDNCHWKWGIKKNELVAVGKNGNKIALPAAGYQRGSKVHQAGAFGFYWSSSPDTSHPEKDAFALGVRIDSGGVFRGFSPRYAGLSVRNIKTQ